MAKFGNVILTRMFPHFKPKPSDDGVKTYALCPFAVPTKLVTDEYAKGIMDPEDAKRKGTYLYDVHSGRGRRGSPKPRVANDRDRDRIFELDWPQRST